MVRRIKHSINKPYKPQPFKSPRRTYCNGIFLGYKRNRTTQHTNTALIEIEGVGSREDVKFYIGKEIAYVYQGTKDKKNRQMLGKVVRAHGNSGVVRARFKKNLPPCAIGKKVRVMLYPCNI